MENQDQVLVNEMTLVEGMKRLHLIEKKIEKNTKQIETYASKLSTNKPYFDSEDEQRKAIQSLIQANEDLTQEYYKLHMRVNFTNMVTKVNFRNEVWTIHEMILYRRRLADAMLKTYGALNDNAAKAQIGLLRGTQDASIERLYDEKIRHQKAEEWMELKETIDGRLETVNATTKLLPFESIPQA